MRVYIHSGHLSADNGALAPLTQYFDLAKLLDIPAEPGVHYYDDSLDIPEEQWPLVEQLLVEGRLLYRVAGVHDQWQNAQSAEVRRVLRLPPAPAQAAAQ